MKRLNRVHELRKQADELEKETLDDIIGGEIIMKYQPTENDVQVTQYLRPNGAKRIVYAPLGEQYAKKAKNMVCSAEQLRSGQIAVYVRWDYQEPEEERIEFAENGPGSREPNTVLKKMIDRLWEEK